MSLWSNRLKKYDEVKSFVVFCFLFCFFFFKKKLFVHFRHPIFSVSYGFTSSSLFHFIFYLDHKHCIYVFTWCCFSTYIHTIWGLDFSFQIKVKHFTFDLQARQVTEAWTAAWPAAPATGCWKEGDRETCVLEGESEKSVEEVKFLFFKTIWLSPVL